MEYIPGGDLYSLLDSLGSLDEETAKIYTMEILDALKYLRSNGIIHRDIKPDNILVTAKGYLKLTDFGLSHLGAFDRQVLLSDPNLASSSSFVGTPDYTAPEIIINKPHTFTADYWSLGVMLYEFLMGSPPFHADTEKETHTNILRCKVDYNALADEGFSHDVIDLLKKLLVVDPNERLGYRSIDDIINHPWFKGVDTRNPPFIPELKASSDTEYFSQRYTFKDEDDSDILEDIAEVNPNIKNEIKGEISKFQAVAVNQLRAKNSKVAEFIRRKSMIVPGHSFNSNYSSLTTANLLASLDDPIPSAKRQKRFTKASSFSNINITSLLSSSSFTNDPNSNESLLIGVNNSTTNIDNSENDSHLVSNDDVSFETDDEFETFPSFVITPQNDSISAIQSFPLEHIPPLSFQSNHQESKSCPKLALMKSNSSDQLVPEGMHKKLNYRKSFLQIPNHREDNLLQYGSFTMGSNTPLKGSFDQKEKNFNIFSRRQTQQYTNKLLPPIKANQQPHPLKPSDISVDLILSATPEDLGLNAKNLHGQSNDE